MRIYGSPASPIFVATDVCRILEIINVSDALQSLDADEKATIANPDSRSGQPGAKYLSVVTESGLYALIFKSRKPEAKAFRKWVTSEVLPAIRKTGAYCAPEAKPKPALPDTSALFALMKLMRKQGVTPDVAAQLASRMLAAEDAKAAPSAQPQPAEPKREAWGDKEPETPDEAEPVPLAQVRKPQARQYEFPLTPAGIEIGARTEHICVPQDFRGEFPLDAAPSLQIEKGIPISARRSNPRFANSGMTALMRKMQPGDSVIYRGKDANGVRRLADHAGIKITAHMESEGVYRVWRVGNEGSVK